jgi:peptidoglycan hydrolase-like protein with peptidoglycan-binding domain
LIKRIIIASAIALTVALVGVASVKAAFNVNLSVGSTGADVSALQSWLISKGYSIPSISSGAAKPGYFGQQTKTAVIAYQASAKIPTTGFVGPLTRAALNGGVSSTPVAVGCPAGYTCTPVGGVTTPVTPVTPGTITTPGVPGILTVTSGPLSSIVSNVGQKMVPVLTVRAQAQYSDLSVQSLTLDLGNNTNVYNKIFNTIYVTDGSNVLASVPLNSSTVVQSGTQYIVGLAGFNVVVPKGTYKDIVIKADSNSSIDSKYLSGGVNYPSTVFSGTGYSGAPSTGWGIALPANSLRAVDGAGLNLYGPTTGFAQALTINTSLVDTAQANVSRNSSSPLAASIPVTDTTNGQYLGLPVLVFDVNAQNDELHLNTVKVGIATTGTGSVGAAYLYQGSTLVTSASVSGGLATFNNIPRGTSGTVIAKDQTLPYTVKVDVTGVTSGTLSVTAAVATSSFSAMTVYNSIDGTVTVNGSASGAAQTVAASGPLFSLASAPTITKTSTSDSAGNVTAVYSATFNVNVTAVGTDVDFGLPASTTASFGTTTTGYNLAQIYKNGAATSTGAVTAAYSKPTIATLSADGSYFTLARNQTATVPVTYTFTILNPLAGSFAVQLQGVQWAKGSAGSALTQTTFMSGAPEWRTNSI